MAGLFVFTVQSTASPQTVSIPDPVAMGYGSEVLIKDGSGGAATNNITIRPVSGTIDGQSTDAIDSNGGAKRYVSDGVQWLDVGGNASGGGSVSFPLDAPANQTLDVAYATADVLDSFTASGAAGIDHTLTADANGALTIDGQSPAQDDRILVKDTPGASSNQVNRGVYVVVAAGDGGSPWILTRASDWDEAAETKSVTYFNVGSGSVNGGKKFACDVGTAGMNFGTTRPKFWDISFGLGATQFSAMDSKIAGTLTVNKLTAPGPCSLGQTGQTVGIGGTISLGSDPTNDTISEFGGTGSAQGAAIADATDAGSVITQLNLLLAYFRTRGTIAT